MIKRLRCKLDASQLKAKGAALANAVSARRAKKTERKNTTATLNAAIKDLDERILQLTRDVEDESEERAVECDEIHDQRLGEIRIERKDTGEVIDRKPMTAEQRAANEPSKAKKARAKKEEAPN